jgi:hypothetical protein
VVLLVRRLRVDLESLDDLDERQLASWMEQAAAIALPCPPRLGRLSPPGALWRGQG